MLYKIIKRLIYAIALLYMYNLIAFKVGMSIAFNYVSIIVIFLFRVPGLALMAVLSRILQ